VSLSPAVMKIETMNPKGKCDIKSLDASETEDWVESLGMERYRGRQVREWIFKKLAADFDSMHTLSREARRLLGESTFLTNLKLRSMLTSEDTTRKYLFELHDGQTIETVLIPERDHLTLCISSQVGCAMGCKFCMTGSQGLVRNLRPAEIIDQVIDVRRTLDDPSRLTNIVFMGMGEPLANFEAVARAVKNIVSADGLDFSHRRVTLSTCGLVPGIIRLGQELTINLAVSLNAADNETRSFLMPVNKKYPIEELLAACRSFPLPNRRMITFEYILINEINDRHRDALKLCKILTGIRAKINLIALNAHSASPMGPPPTDRILSFQQVLIDHNYTAVIRKSKGRDILAACGQLRSAFEKDGMDDSSGRSNS
jgi:23S rRNA (adenine2503-C2)-methyltransferase